MSHFSLNTIDNKTFYNISFVKKSVRRILLAGPGFITYSSTCYAVVEDIPEESGFHGNHERLKQPFKYNNLPI